MSDQKSFEFKPETFGKYAEMEKATGLILSTIDWNDETGTELSFSEGPGKGYIVGIDKNGEQFEEDNPLWTEDYNA